MGSLFDKKQQSGGVGITPGIHLLLCGPSKTGKTDYVADLVIDGYTILYVDNDNGLNTLYKRIKHNDDYLKRVFYVKTSNIWNFLTAFFARDVFRWNETRDEYFSEKTAEPTDSIITIEPKRMPFGIIVIFDSWTSITNQLLMDSAKKNQVPYESFNESGQSVYGDAKRRADQVLMNIQSFPNHVIVQAHTEFYERLEKPKGAKANVKQSEMLIKDNIEIPMSVSRPHAYSMSKFFNEVGWMRIKPNGDFALDFRQKSDRVGGGSPMKEGDPKTEMRFSKLFEPPRIIEGEWFRTVEAAGLIEEAAAEAERKRLEREEQARERAANKAANKPVASTTSSTPSVGGTTTLFKKT